MSAPINLQRYTEQFAQQAQCNTNKITIEEINNTLYIYSTELILLRIATKYPSKLEANSLRIINTKKNMCLAFDIKPTWSISEQAKDFDEDENGDLTYKFTSNLVSEGTFSTEELGTQHSEMTIYFHNEEKTEGNIEWIVEELDIVETIGVWFDEKGNLEDYDGVFSLPSQAIELMIHSGMKVPQDMR